MTTEALGEPLVNGGKVQAGLDVSAVLAASDQGSLLTPVISSPFQKMGRPQSPSRTSRSTQKRLRLQVFVSVCIMFAEGFYATQLFPYCPSMAEELRGSMEGIGFFSGLMYTAQSAGMLTTSYLWATTSNKIGRRTCLLSGLCCNIFASLLLAMNGTYWLAVGIRLMAGLLNSNLSLMRTSLRESFSYEEEEDTQAFSTLSVAFGASSVMGPSLGGLLYGRYVPFLGPYQHHWTMPMLSCALLYAVTLVVAFLYLPETAFLTRPLHLAGSAATSPSSQKTSSKGKLTSLTFCLLLLMGGAHSYIFTGWELVYPLFARIPASQVGESWSTAQVGVTFLVGSIMLMLYALFMYPRLARKMPMLKMWIWSWVPVVAMLPLFPRLLTLAISNGWSETVISLTNYGAQVLVSLLCGSQFISIQLLLNGYVSKLPSGSLAPANGMLVSMQAAVRALSPVITGTLFTVGLDAESDTLYGTVVTRALPFDSLAVMGAVGCILCAVLFGRHQQQQGHQQG